MRKALTILLLAFALCLGGAVYAFTDAAVPRDEVEVSEIVRYGDVSAAEGLRLVMHTNFDHHLFWDTYYTPTAPEETLSDYRVSTKKDYGNWDGVYTGIYLRGDLDVPVDIEERGPALTGLGKAYYELFQELAPGEEIEKEIRLADYLEYYPISGDMNLPGLTMSLYPDDFEWRGEENNDVAHGFLSTYFRIPVLENETFHIHLSKDENGLLNGRGGGTGSSEDFYSLYTDSVILPDAIYFTINNRTNLKNAIVDTSLIPGGYGIYRLPCKLENGQYSIKFYELSTVKSLDEEFEVIFLLTDEPQEKLLLIGKTDEELRMLVVDVATMETLQDIEIVSEGNTGCWQYYDGGDFLVLSIDDSRLALIERQANGEYILRFVVEDTADGELYNRYDVKAWAWNGDKLAASGFKSLDDINERYVVDFYYAVFDETGMLCFTDCDSSLCVNEDEEWYGVRHDDYEPMELEWK